MKRFSFIARNQQGKAISGAEEAENVDSLVLRLQSRGLLVTNIKVLSNAALDTAKPQSKISFKQKFRRLWVTNEDQIMFARQLATAIGSGVPLLRSLDIIRRQVDSRKFFTIINTITKDVESGLSFRDAVAKYPKVFSNLWVSLIETGEASGTLPAVLEKLASYLEKQAAFKRKIVSALIYPIILTLVAIGAIAVFMGFVVPKFAEVFKNFDMELPVPTKVLITISSYFKQYFQLILFAAIGIIIALGKMVQLKPVKAALDKNIFKIPLINEYARLFEIEKFAMTMAILLESGVPILYAMDIGERSSSNIYVKGILHTISTNVRNGKPVGSQIEESGFFPPMVSQMVTIGEEIGELDNMFKKISSYYSEILETNVTRFTSMFEPIMIVVMALIVGTMVICMFLPIFKLTTMGVK